MLCSQKKCNVALNRRNEQISLKREMNVAVLWKEADHKTGSAFSAPSAGVLVCVEGEINAWCECASMSSCECAATVTVTPANPSHLSFITHIPPAIHNTIDLNHLEAKEEV